MDYADWPLSAPVNLTWEITHKCNLNCVHCLSASRTEMPDELDLKEAKAVVDQIADIKVFEINFGGGEPLLKDYFFSLIDYIHSKEIVTCISTNGTLLSDEAVNRLSDNPLVNIQVSLDGATPAVNDKMRGEGSYFRIIEGIELLSKRKTAFSINTVVTALNFNQLEEIKALAISHGAGLRISRFRPSGRAKASWEDLKLSYSQLEKLSGWLTAHPDILTGDSFFSISNRGRPELGLDMCGACKMTCCIDPCGSVYPCAFLQEPHFYSGNLKESRLKQIWDHSAIFLKLRDLEPASCKTCPRLSACHGGCPAVAYFVSRSLDSSDPECLAKWRKEVTSLAAG